MCRRENHDYSGLEAHIEYNIREGSRGASAGPVHTTSSFRMGGYRIIDLPDLSTDGPGEYFVRAVVTLKDAKGAELQTSENYTPNFRVVKDLANSGKFNSLILLVNTYVYGYLESDEE